MDPLLGEKLTPYNTTPNIAFMYEIEMITTKELLFIFNILLFPVCSV